MRISGFCAMNMKLMTSFFTFSSPFTSSNVVSGTRLVMTEPYLAAASVSCLHCSSYFLCLSSSVTL